MSKLMSMPLLVLLSALFVVQVPLVSALHGAPVEELDDERMLQRSGGRGGRGRQSGGRGGRRGRGSQGGTGRGFGGGGGGGMFGDNGGDDADTAAADGTNTPATPNLRNSQGNRGGVGGRGGDGAQFRRGGRPGRGRGGDNCPDIPGFPGLAFFGDNDADDFFMSNTTCPEPDDTEPVCALPGRRRRWFDDEDSMPNNGTWICRTAFHPITGEQQRQSLCVDTDWPALTTDTCGCCEPDGCPVLDCPCSCEDDGVLLERTMVGDSRGGRGRQGGRRGGRRRGGRGFDLDEWLEGRNITRGDYDETEDSMMFDWNATAICFSPAEAITLVASNRLECSTSCLDV